MYFAGSAELYGSDRALERIVVAQLAAGGEALVICAETGPLVARLREAGAAVEVMPLVVLRRNLATRRGLRRLLSALAATPFGAYASGRGAQPDLIHSNGVPVLSGAVVARFLGIPHVWHLREDLASMPAGRLLGNALAAGADAVVSVSNHVAREASRLCPRIGAKSTVVYEGVDTDRLIRLPDRSAAASQLDLDPALPTVACLARINPWKGQEVLVDAAGLMRAAGLETQVVLAGGIYPGDERVLAALESQIARKGLAEKVRLVGFRADQRSVLAAADIVAAPSTRPEPYGLSVVEALSAGRPVVASDAGGHRETIRRDVDGLLVPPGDPRALAAALTRLLEDGSLRESLSEAALEGRDRHSSLPGTKAMLGIFSDLAARG